MRCHWIVVVHLIRHLFPLVDEVVVRFQISRQWGFLPYGSAIFLGNRDVKDGRCGAANHAWSPSRPGSAVLLEVGSSVPSSVSCVALVSTEPALAEASMLEQSGPN